MPHQDQQERFNEVLAENRQRFGKIARFYADDAAEDLLQEILLQVWRSLPGYRGDAKLSTWCYRVAVNTALGYRRKQAKRKEQSAGESMESEPSTDSLNEACVRSSLQRFLVELNDVDQSVVLMHLDRLSPEEIAEVLGNTVGAIQTRLSRIRTKLATWEDDCG